MKDMKTLGQIAHEAWVFMAGAGFNWKDLPPIGHESWEAAAQAVRAAVIEECARCVDGMSGFTSDPEWALKAAATAIRTLEFR